MSVVILLSIATCLSLITIVFGCLICRRKLSDQDIQRKAFEKFRKRHMLHRNKMLSNRVDYVRSVSEGRSALCMSGVSDHSYEVMSTPPEPRPPVIQVEETSPLHSSDYSFFDDSFQTVIEASSSNMSSSNSGSTNLLAAPRDLQASYISLQQDGSHACLRTAVEQAMSESEGEINQGFSSSSNSSADNMGSTDSLNDSYIAPRCRPKFKILQPSVKRTFDLSTPHANVQNSVLCEIQLPVGNTARNSSDPRNKYKQSSDSTKLSTEEDTRDGSVFDENLDNTEKKQQGYHGDQKLRQESLQMLAMEGHTYSRRSLSLDSNENASYEKLHSSRSEQCMYKSLHKTALVLPGKPRMCTPVTPLRSSKANLEPLPGISRQSSSTGSYESINSILACEMNRRDSVESVEQDSAFDNTGHGYISKSPTHKGHCTDKQNDLSSASSDHTYESIKSKAESAKEKSEIACENSAVIIGRRVSNPFDSNIVSKRMINKKKQKNMKNNINQSEKKVQRDSEERYSPFPVTKKLAFKSAFKQVSSPRFSVIQTVTGNMSNQIVFKPEICHDNLNIKTPEIKVENSSQFYDNTSFFSFPNVRSANTIFTEDESQKDPKDLISPIHLTLNCISSKVSHSNLQTSLTEKPLKYRKSLPSLSDNLEEDIVKYCNTNVYSRSTPCELNQQNCTGNYF